MSEFKILWPEPKPLNELIEHFERQYSPEEWRKEYMCDPFPMPPKEEEEYLNPRKVKSRQQPKDFGGDALNLSLDPANPKSIIIYHDGRFI
jgi:hypothetical protein